MDHAQTIRQLHEAGAPVEHLITWSENHLRDLRLLHATVPDRAEAIADYEKVIADLRQFEIEDLIRECRELVPDILVEDLAAEQYALKRAADALARYAGVE